MGRIEANYANLNIYTDKVEKDGGNHIADNIYYTLHPENIKDIVQRRTSRDTVIMNAITRSTQYFPILTPPIPGQLMKTYDATLNFRKALKDHSPNGHTITAFDLETFSGKDAKGIDRLYGIYDYSFIKVDNTGKKVSLGGLIGIQDNNVKDKMDSIISALEKGQKLTNEQEIAYEYISRLGASLDKIKKVNGRWVSEGLNSGTGFQNISNFKAGYNKLLEIGEEQGTFSFGSGFGIQAGYKQLLDDIKASIDENTIIAGHNIKGFDIPVLRNILDIVPGAKAYASSIGLNMDQIFSSNAMIYDTLEQWRDIKGPMANDYIRQLYANGVINPDLTLHKLDAIWQANRPDGFSGVTVHHNAFGDTMKVLQYMGILPYTDEATGGTAYARVGITEQMERSFIQAINDYDADSTNQTIENVFNQKLTLRALNGSSQYSDRFQSGIFGVVQRGDEHFFSDGIKLGTNQIDRYAPGLFKKDAFYTLDPNDIKMLDPEKDKNIIAELKKRKWHFGGNDKIYALTLRSSTSEWPDGYNRAENVSTIFIPESEFEQTFVNNFSIVKVGDQITDAGRAVEKTAYSTNGKHIRKYTLDELIGIQARSKIRDEVAENAARRIQDGSTDALLKGLQIKYILNAVNINNTKVGHGEITMSNLTEALKNIRKDNGEAFNAIVSGLDATQRLTVTQIFGGTNFFDPNYWIKAWNIKDTFNAGWQDNTFAIAKTVNVKSPAAKLAMAISKMGIKDSNEAKTLFGRSLSRLMEERLSGAEDISDLYEIAGIRQNAIRYAGDTVNMYMPDFFRQYNKSGRVFDGYMSLNLASPDSFMKKLTGLYSDRNQINIRGREEQKGILINFLDHFVDSQRKSRGIFSDDALAASQDLKTAYDNILNIQEAILNDNDDQLLSKYVSDFFGELQTVKNLYEKGNIAETSMLIGEKPNTQTVLLDSSLFTKADDTFDAEALLKDEKNFMDNFSFTKAPKTEEEYKNLIQDYFSGGEELAQQYRREIAGLKDLNNGKEYYQRLALFKAQQEASKQYADNLITLLAKNGGYLYVDDRSNKLLIRFGGQDFDMTGVTPRLESNKGVLYHRIGNSAYATEQTVTGLDRYGRAKVNSVLGSEITKLFTGKDSAAAKMFEKNKLTGAYTPSSTARYLMGSIAATLREKEGLADTLLKDARRNTFVRMDPLLRDQYTRNQLLSYLSRADIPKDIRDNKDFQVIYNFLKRNEKTKDPIEIINLETSNALRTLFHNNILDNTFELESDSPGSKPVEFIFNALIKDSSEQDLSWSASNTFYGGSAFDNPGRGITHVQEHTIQFNEEVINENYKKIVGGENQRDLTEQFYYDKNGNRIKGKVTGIKTRLEDIFSNGLTTNRIGVRKAEVTTASIMYRLEQMNYDLDTLRRIGMKVQTLEGGGYLSARIVRALGFVPGSKSIPLAMRQVTGLSDIEIINQDGKFGFKYGRANIVNKNNNLIKSYSSYGDTDEELKAERASMVRREFYTKAGMTRITEAQAQRLVYQEAARRNIDIRDAKTFRRLADELFTERATATPLAIEGPIKGLTGVDEKHIMQTAIGTLRDVQNPEAQRIVNMIAKANAQFKGSLDIRDIALNEEIYQDIASGNFQSGLFQRYDMDDVREEIAKFNANGGNWKAELEKARMDLDEKITRPFGGADVLAQNDLADAIKHQTRSKVIIGDTFNRLREEYIRQGMSIADATQQAGLDIQSFVVNKEDRQAISIDSIGNIIMPNNDNIKIDVEKYKKIAAKLPSFAELIGNNDYYISNDSLSIIDDASNINKMAKFGQREINSLMNLVYDDDVLEDVKRKMADDKKFTSLFGDIIDKKEKRGIAVWRDAVASILASNFGIKEYRNEKGELITEELFDVNSKDIPDELREGYNETYKSIRRSMMQDLGEEPVISLSTVRNRYEYESAARALMAADVNTPINEETRKRFSNKQNIRDIYLGFGNDRNYSQKSSKNIWERDTVLNLVDDEIGLTKEWLQENGLETELYVPGAKVEAFKNSSGSLRDFQRTVSSIASDYKKLAELQNNSLPEAAGLAQEIRSGLRGKLLDYYTQLKKYATSEKEGSVNFDLLNRRAFASAQGKLNVFDVNTLVNNNGIDILDNFKYNGESIKDLYQKKNSPVSFMVASTKDLEKFGFTDQYFKDIGVDKAEWLAKAKTEGIRALGNRAPADYLGSTRGVQLYFSDDVSKGMMLMDSISATLMKGDADGDIVRALALGTRLRNGQFIDDLSADLTTNEDFKNQLSGSNLNNIRLAYDRAQAINQYSQNRVILDALKGDWDAITSDNSFANIYDERIKDKIADLLTKRNINNNIYSYSVSNLGKEQADKAYKAWDTAANAVVNMLGQIEGANKELMDFQNSSDAGKFVKTLNILNDESGRYKMSAEVREAISSGAREYQRLMDPYVMRLVKGTRTGAGEIDTPFFVMDALVEQLTTDTKLADAVRLSQEQITQVNILRMAAKEGFLSPKHADEALVADPKYRNFVTNVSSAFNMMLRGGKEAAEGRSLLANTIIENGRDMTKQSGRTVPQADDIIAGVENLQTIFDMLDPKLKSNIGTMKNYMVAGLIDSYASNAINPATLTNNMNRILLDFDEARRSIFVNRQEGQEAAATIIKAAQEAVEDAVDNSKSETAQVAFLNGKIPRILPKLSNNWGAVLGLAAGLMFAGYAGGNPAEPIGNEASQDEEPEQVQQLPPLTDSALTSMRGGPKQGYIININAQTDHETDYASRLISQAVTDNFTNSQINISMNVNETQSSIDSNAMYEYFVNSL